MYAILEQVNMNDILKAVNFALNSIFKYFLDFDTNIKYHFIVPGFSQMGAGRRLGIGGL